MKTFGGVLLVFAMIILAFSTLGSVGYFLYLWAHGTAVGMAAWVGFVTWLKAIGSALLLGTIGITLNMVGK